MALLLAKKITVPAKYSYFANVFLAMSTNILSEWTGANKHAIELEKAKQLPYEPIYSLDLVELETFKTYIEINLVNSFIQTSKLPVDAPILFVRKPNGNFSLCIDYQNLNNLKIKSWYLLPLSGEFLDWLNWAKQFTQLDFTSVCHLIRIKKGNE